MGKRDGSLQMVQQLVSTLLFLVFMSVCSLKTAQGLSVFPRIVQPSQDTEGVGSPLLLIITNGEPRLFSMPCEVHGLHTSLEWGVVSDEDPYRIGRKEDFMREVTTTRPMADDPQMVEIKTLYFEGPITAMQLNDKKFRCMATYKSIRVYSPIVSMDIIEANRKPEYLGGISLSDPHGEGFVLLPCVDWRNFTVAGVNKYSKYFKSMWKVESGANSIPFIIDVRSIAFSRGVIEFAGNLFFSFFSESDLNIIPDRAPDQDVYYTCTLVPKDGISQQFPFNPASRYKVDNTTVSSRNGNGVQRLQWIGPSNVFAVAGETTSLSCLFSRRRSTGYPIVSWLFTNNNQATPDLAASNAALRSNFAYIEFVAKPEYSGTIQCGVDGVWITSFVYEVVERIRLVDPSGVKDHNLLIGDRVRFNCSTNVPVAITWFFNGNDIANSGTNYFIGGQQGSLLQLFDVQPPQSGSISCSASNRAGQFYAEGHIIISPPVELSPIGTSYHDNETTIVLEDTNDDHQQQFYLEASWIGSEFFLKEKLTWWQKDYANSDSKAVNSDMTRKIVTGKTASTLTFTLSSGTDVTLASGYYFFSMELNGTYLRTQEILLLSDSVMPILSSELVTLIVVSLAGVVAGIVLLVLSLCWASGRCPKCIKCWKSHVDGEKYEDYELVDEPEGTKYYEITEEPGPVGSVWSINPTASVLSIRSRTGPLPKQPSKLARLPELPSEENLKNKSHSKTTSDKAVAKTKKSADIKKPNRKKIKDVKNSKQKVSGSKLPIKTSDSSKPLQSDSEKQKIISITSDSSKVSKITSENSKPLKATSEKPKIVNVTSDSSKMSKKTSNNSKQSTSAADNLMIVNISSDTSKMSKKTSDSSKQSVVTSEQSMVTSKQSIATSDNPRVINISSDTSNMNH